MFLCPFYFYYVLVLVRCGESVLQSDGATSVVRRLGSIDQGLRRAWCVEPRKCDKFLHD